MTKSIEPFLKIYETRLTYTFCLFFYTFRFGVKKTGFRGKTKDLSANSQKHWMIYATIKS